MADTSICGLALAAFPIAISELEPYKEVARGRMRLQWRKAMNELKYHQLLFVRNTRLLLAPIVNDVELHRLTTSPSGNIWSDPDLARALKEKLKDSYDVFLKTIIRVFSALNQFLKEIHVANNDISEGVSGEKEPRQTETTLTQERLDAPRDTKSQVLRVKFTLGESVCKDVFDDIQACNDILGKLILKNDSVSISHPIDKIRVGSMEAALCNFWRHADKLYKALFTAWKCECPDRHSSHFELQPRLNSSDQEIRLVLSTHTRNGEWSTLPVIVKIGQEVTEPSIRASSQREAGMGRAPGSKRKITVKFADTPSAEKHISTNSSMSFENQPINNLCTTLGNRSSLNGVSSIGYLRDQDGGEYHDKFYICPGRPCNATSKSLSEFIGEGVKPRLTRRQRYYLAVAISSSFIQLKDTSWFPETLENPWSKNSIFIPADAEDPDIFFLTALSLHDALSTYRLLKHRSALSTFWM
ncbi:hypothetical protein F5Y12DRAFT_795714 [Xylaria sp. FL1777]|nr:hypothetical protein F5Y12DRAFT_795714 [Xylaria sp. FL1777]